ncbi:MAG TPA: Gfo/Idh/MocA family oxidoreductase [Polyangiaceae bacterium]|jgi:predicted dehydrogenase
MEAKRKIRWAVVGLGNIAQVAVLPAFEHASENSELVALVSSDAEKLRVLSKKYDVSITGSYDELDRVVRDGDADAVYVAVPNSLHRDMTERAARAGAHVLCEKPMATTVADCEAMIRATDDANVKLMIAYRLHFEGTNLEAIERVRRGDIGEPRIFTSVFTHQVREGDIRTRAETGGGALFDMGTYCLNAVRYIFRAEPLSVAAMQSVGTEERFRHVDEMTTAILRFPGERIAQFVASQGAANVSEFRVVGTDGHIRLDPAYEYATAVEGELNVEGKTTKVKGEKKDQFAPEIVYFASCILDDETPEPSGEEGLADVRVMEAIIRAAATRSVVDLPPFEKRERPSERLEIRKPPVGKQKTIHAPSPSQK